MKLLLATCLCLPLACLAPAAAVEPAYTSDDEMTLQQCFEAVNDTNSAENTDTVSLHDCIGAASGICQGIPGGDSTQGMVACNQREEAWWDAQLNTYYDQLQSNLEPDVAESLKLAQRAWLKYRDAKCTFVDQLWRDGTIHSVMASYCTMDATATRAIELGTALDERR